MLDLDPFFEACRFYQDDLLVVIVAKQLVGDDDGKLHRAQRVIIHTLEIDELDATDELDDLYENEVVAGADEQEEDTLFIDISTLPIVYDHYIREDFHEHTEIFVRGSWLKHLTHLREQL